MDWLKNTCSEIQSIISGSLDQILHLRSIKKLKTDDSYVSEGDLLCERLVIEHVTSLKKNIFILSEESKNNDFSFDNYQYVLVIDPIDGTENFVSGLKEWGIGLSFYDRHKHAMSMIGLPELNMWMKSGDKIDAFNSRIYGLSSSLSKQNILDLEEGFEYRIIGCCMYNMYNVIRGSYSVFQNPKGAHCWDILPGLNLALENNCKVIVENKPYHGEFLYPNRKYRFRIEHQ